MLTVSRGGMVMSASVTGEELQCTSRTDAKEMYINKTDRQEAPVPELLIVGGFGTLKHLMKGDRNVCSNVRLYFNSA
jgi:hypothetical protein